ncbi:MAG: NUDIX hydrolase [Chloroflexi bacterium HGW-Chloroflexi-1]|nr:MAG: NUDIX hydrolase [Chloroflexi bacterium HGW-Chloroflexi-1]
MADDHSERMFPTRPLAGVGAVVWDGARLLLEQRGQEPARGLWAVPGGLIELGETAEDAVRREVREECGIDVTVGPLLGLFEPVQRDPDDRIRYHYVVIDFLAYYRSGTLRVGDDAADVRWVAPADLAQYEMLPATRAMIDRALAHLNGETAKR